MRMTIVEKHYKPKSKAKERAKVTKALYQSRMNRVYRMDLVDRPPLTQQDVEAMHERTPVATNGRYFTKALLVECANNWDIWDFNRQLSEEVKELPDLFFPVLYAMVHKHAFFKRREAHIRCEVLLSPAPGIRMMHGKDASWAGERHSCFVDVPLEFFNDLPTC